MSDANQMQPTQPGSDDDLAEWQSVLTAGVLNNTELPAYKVYSDLFIKYAKKAPCHVKTGYERGFLARRRAYKHKPGSYDQPFYDGLMDRHLDADPARPFWVALRFGRRSALRCLDLDNKGHILGYYRTGGNQRPVVRLPLAHMMRAKRLYDALPGHVWCVSSATLGLHVWERLPHPMTPAEVERRTRPLLTGIGLGGTEVYPSPRLANQVLRRPFGLDYHTLTDGGLLTWWEDQTEHFAAATTPPGFGAVAKGMLAVMVGGWGDCERSGSFRPSAASPFVTNRRLDRSRLDQEVREVLAWVRAGCPTELPTSSDPPPGSPVGPTGSSLTHIILPDTPPRPAGRVRPSGWWGEVRDLARHGVPEEHRLFEYLLLLARPLVWRDYYHLPVADRLRHAENDLTHWVKTKHNGLVTRVRTGDWDGIRHEVRRQVRVAHETANRELQAFFAGVRERDRQHPERVERVSDIIRGRTNTLPPPVCCMRINKEPDDTPLPGPVSDRIDHIILAERMRRRDGEYPFARFARRVLNALWAEDGAATLDRDTLLAFCESKNPNQQLLYKKLLAEHGLISDQWEGHVRPGAASAVYQMTAWAFDRFQGHHGTAKTMRRVEGRFVVTGLTEAALAAIRGDWPDLDDVELGNETDPDPG